MIVVIRTIIAMYHDIQFLYGKHESMTVLFQKTLYKGSVFDIFETTPGTSVYTRI